MGIVDLSALFRTQQKGQRDEGLHQLREPEELDGCGGIPWAEPINGLPAYPGRQVGFCQGGTQASLSLLNTTGLPPKQGGQMRRAKSVPTVRVSRRSPLALFRMLASNHSALCSALMLPDGSVELLKAASLCGPPRSAMKGQRGKEHGA